MANCKRKFNFVILLVRCHKGEAGENCVSTPVEFSMIYDSPPSEMQKSLIRQVNPMDPNTQHMVTPLPYIQPVLDEPQATSTPGLLV